MNRQRELIWSYISCYGDIKTLVEEIRPIQKKHPQVLELMRSTLHDPSPSQNYLQLRNKRGKGKRK